MAREVDIAAFAAAHAGGALVIDVREPDEYLSGHVPGARLVPIASVPDRAAELPAGEPVYVICASGNRSAAAADWLRNTGIDAWSVAGGTGSWIVAGHPVVYGLPEGSA